MLRKLSILPVITLVLAMLFSVTALADSPFNAILNQANMQIQMEINRAEADANNALADLNNKISFTNHLLKLGKISQMEADSRIDNFQADFDNLLYAISSRLIANTNNIVVNVLQAANRYNIKVSVSYIEVTLAGHVYLVDPLRIIGH